jgi:hypothetical protein
VRAASALRWASRAVAAVWLLSALALHGAELRRSGAAREATAHIEAVPLAGAPASAPEPLRVGAAEIARGGELLDAGAFPVLVASYAEFPSFRDYALAMQALGARLAIVRGGRIVGHVDLERGVVGEGRLRGEFSPRARDYSDEPGLAGVAAAARLRFGAGSEVMLLVPRQIVASLFGAIAGALPREAGELGGLREVRARYLRGPGGGVRLRVDAAVRRDGGEAPLDLLFDLGALAR